jgi:hypothetical protein
MASGIKGPGGICEWKETGEKNLMTQSAVSVVGTPFHDTTSSLRN